MIGLRKHIWLVGLICIGLDVLCLSCADEEKAVVSTDNGGEGSGKEITLTVPVRVADMETAVSHPTRTAGTDANSAMQVGWDTTACTRADKDAAEKSITSLHLYQFDGADGNAPLVKYQNLGKPDLSSGNKVFTIRFITPNKSPNQTVYILANVTATVNMGDLKSKFDQQIAAGTNLCMTAVPANGLPMCAYRVFDPMTVTTVPLLTLKAMVAKVKYSFKYLTLRSETRVPMVMADFLSPETFSVTLKNIANGTGYGEPSNFANAYTPTGGNKNGERLLGGLSYYEKNTINIREFGYKLEGTLYIPENIAGQSAGINSDLERSSAKAKPGATYFELHGRDDSGGFKVTYALFMGTPGQSNDFNVRRNCVYDLTVNLLGLNEVDKRLTMQNDFINLSAGGTANCYIVTQPNTAYGINATVRGNNNTSVAGIDYGSLPLLSEARRASCLWETGSNENVIKKIGYRRNFLVFTTGTATEGNAVIAACDAGSAIIWSWHIWMLPSTPSTVNCQKYPAGDKTKSPVEFQMMDRNLGAYNNTVADPGSIGLFYQWGRKDPFPSVATFSGGSIIINGSDYVMSAGSYSTYGTEYWAAKLPTRFITRGTSDWLQVRTPSLWGNPWVDGGATGYNASAGQKSIYDPCPVGYRVPPSDTWSAVTGAISGTKNGRRLKGITKDDINGLYFPNGGYRKSENGGWNNGGCGCNWTSSPTKDAISTKGIIRFFHPEEGDNLKRPTSRATGGAVRCIKE